MRVMGKKTACLLLCAALLLGAAGCASKPVQTAPGLTYNELLAAFRQTAEVPLAQKLEYVNSENWRFIDGRVWAYGSSFATEEGDSQRLLASCQPDGGDAAFLPVQSNGSAAGFTAKLEEGEYVSNNTLLPTADTNGTLYLLQADCAERQIEQENGYWTIEERDETRCYTLRGIAEDGQLTPGVTLQLPGDGAERFRSVSNLFFDRANNLWVCFYGDPTIWPVKALLCCFSPQDGSCQQTVELPDGFVPHFNSIAVLPDDTFLLIGDSFNEYGGASMYTQCYRLKDAAAQPQLEAVEMPADYGSLGSFVFSDRSFLQQVMVNCTDGVYCWDWETGELTAYCLWADYNISNNDVRAVFALPEEKLLVIQKEEGEPFRFVTLTPMGDDLLADRPTVTLGLLDSTGSLDMKKLAEAYNGGDPAVYVKTVDYTSAAAAQNGFADGSAMLQDALRKGAAPDILLLPNDAGSAALIRQGLFLDLAPYLDADDTLSREDLLPGVLQACEVDGKLPTLIPAFSLLTAAGAADVVGDGMGWSWQQFDALCAAHPQAIPYAALGRDEALLYQLQLGGEKYIDYAAGQAHLDTPDFVRLLQASAAYPQQSEELASDFKPVFAAGQALLQVSFFNDYRTLLALQYAADGPVSFKGFPTDDGGCGSAVIPTVRVTINSRCTDPQAAWAFVRTLFGEEAQRTVTGSFPARRSALQAMEQAAMQPDENAQPPFYLAELPLTENQLADWQRGLTQEETDQITALVEATCQLYQYDGAVAEILWEEADYFYNGARTATEAAALMQNRVQTYLDEQG